MGFLCSGTVLNTSKNCIKTTRKKARAHEIFSCSHGLSGTAPFSYERFFTGLTSMNPTYLTWYLRKMTEAVRH